MGLLDGLAHCYEHDCPLIQINDEHVCLFEYVDGLISGQPITDVLPGDQQRPTRLVFSSGRTWPLSCAHCGAPAHFDDMDELLDQGTSLIRAALTYLKPDGDQIGPKGGWGVHFAESDDPADLKVEPLITHLRSAREIQ